MSSTNSYVEPIEKVTSDNGALGFDLLSNLTYMSVLTIGGIPRDQLMEMSGRQPLRTAVFFSSVHCLVNAAGFEYTRAFKLVAGKAKSNVVRSLFLRFAAAISSGESENDFLLQETAIAMERYKNEYDRSVENLRKWTDAYAAILVSVTLVMVVCLISTLMASMNEMFIAMMGVSVTLITGLGVYVIYRVSPLEKSSYDGEKCIPKERKYARRFLFVLVPIGVISALGMGFRFDLMAGAAVAFVIMGAALLPAGMVALREDRSIRDIDSNLHTFLRSLGNIAGATGSNITLTLNKIDNRSMGFLGPYIRRLQLRLSAQISSYASWEKFREETGSELVSRTTRMFTDGSERGGKADEVGGICSDYALSVSQMREKRRLVSSTFSFLTVPMHATMVFILVFVLEILSVFNSKLTEISGSGLPDVDNPIYLPSNLDVPSGLSISTGAELSAGLGLFTAQNLTVISIVILIFISVLTLANGLAPKFASGGSNFKIAFFLSLMCLLSGLILGTVPLLSDKLFAI